MARLALETEAETCLLPPSSALTIPNVCSPSFTYWLRALDILHLLVRILPLQSLVATDPRKTIQSHLFFTQILVTQPERPPYIGSVTFTALLGLEGWDPYRTADWWNLRHHPHLVVVGLLGLGMAVFVRFLCRACIPLRIWSLNFLEFSLVLLLLLLLVAILLQASVSFVAISYPFDGGGWFEEGRSFACGVFWGFGHGCSRWACLKACFLQFLTIKYLCITISKKHIISDVHNGWTAGSGDEIEGDVEARA